MPGLLRFVNLLPVALLGAYFVVGFLLFTWRTFAQGSYRDPEIAGRPTSVLLGAWIRNYFAWLMLPVVALLVAAGVPPDAITSVSVLFALAAGVSMAVGQFALGGGLYLAAGICDYLDGRVARICRQTTSRGAALDSILDRYAEAAMIIGLAWFYRDQWVLLALLMFLSGSFLVPYIRARGESLGIDMKVGLMQRPERLVILGLAALACPLVDWMLPAAWQVVPHPLVVAAIVLLAVSTQCTAAYRLWYVGSLLDADGAKRPQHKTSREVTIGNTLVTVLDFAIVVLAVGRLAWPAWLATGLSYGVLVAVYFAWLRRCRVPEAVSASRSGVVALGGALLSAGGMAVLAQIELLDYRLAWFIVRGAVAWAWNYQLTLPTGPSERSNSAPESSVPVQHKPAEHPVASV